MASAPCAPQKRQWAARALGLSLHLGLGSHPETLLERLLGEGGDDLYANAPSVIRRWAVFNPAVACDGLCRELKTEPAGEEGRGEGR